MRVEQAPPGHTGGAHRGPLHFVYYNFCRKHQTLTKARSGIHTTPAMAAGLTDRLWKVENILMLMDA